MAWSMNELVAQLNLNRSDTINLSEVVNEYFCDRNAEDKLSDDESLVFSGNWI